jgi:hypothetical protein
MLFQRPPIVAHRSLRETGPNPNRSLPKSFIWKGTSTITLLTGIIGKPKVSPIILARWLASSGFSTSSEP